MSENLENEPEIVALGEFLSHFNKESDRGATLIAAAMLDERLANILFAFLANTSTAKQLLAGFNAPLGTFSSRASAAHALGLIQDNEYKEITIVRKIRNEFGHSWQGVTFASEKVTSLCNQLPWLGPKEMERTASPRTRFSFALAILLNDLLWRARLVSREKRVAKKWTNTSRGG